MKLILFLFAISLSSFALGQDELTSTSEPCDSTKNFFVVSDLPEYKGGIEKLQSDLNDNLIFENTLSGTCPITFIVNCKGKASGFKVKSSFDKSFDNKIIEALMKLQNWSPAKFKDRDVDSSYTLTLVVENGKIKIKRK